MIDFATPATASTALATVAPVPDTAIHFLSGHSTPASVTFTVSSARGLFPQPHFVHHPTESDMPLYSTARCSHAMQIASRAAASVSLAGPCVAWVSSARAYCTALDLLSDSVSGAVPLGFNFTPSTVRCLHFFVQIEWLGFSNIFIAQHPPI